MFKKIISIVPIAALSFTVVNAQAAPITVEKGDSLWDLAREYNTSVENIQVMNQLSSTLIHPGDVLAMTEKNKYIVKNGDSLWSIAKQFNISVSQIKQWNQLKTETIHPGDSLSLGIDYIVKDGDSLWNIARNYNTTVTQIKKYNQLNTDLIKPGLNLVIPENQQSDNSTYNSSNTLTAVKNQTEQQKVLTNNSSTSTNGIANNKNRQEATTPSPTVKTEPESSQEAVSSINEDAKQENTQKTTTSTKEEAKQESIQENAPSTNEEVKYESNQEAITSTNVEAKHESAQETVPSTKEETKLESKTKENTTTSNNIDENEFSVEATAYTANCEGCTGVTSTGIDLKANPNAKVISVDPTVIPLGSKVEVEGYGEAIAGDTGSNIKGNKIDVFVSSKEEAEKFGKQTLKVKILK